MKYSPDTHIGNLFDTFLKLLYLISYPFIHPSSNNMSFHFVLVGRTFSTTFSPVVSVRVLCGITSARGAMMVARVAVVCLVDSLGFFKPTFP
jgi:hypothetical protein